MKRIVIFLFLALVLGGGGAGAYLYYSNTSASPISPKGEDAAMVEPTPTPKLVTWDDPSGFTTSYPEGLAVDKHDEDTEHYAHVEFTDPKHPGRLVIWVKDLPKGVTDTTSWGKKISASPSAILFETTLGGKPAQKVLTSSPAKTVSVGVVYDGVLWIVESELTDSDYWQSIHDSVTGAFAFKPTTSEPAAGAAPVEQSFDEEEVLE